MYCVIQEMELKKENTYGEYKELEVYKIERTINDVEECIYSYRHTGDQFERPIRKAYKISIHKSYRENGKVKKKQWAVCTMNYYGIADNFTWIKDCMISSKWASLLEEIGVTEEEFCTIVYKKLDPLIEQIQNEYHQTEEYKTHQEHRKIIDKYFKAKDDFRNKYDSDSYDYYYDVFGVLREEEKFEAFKKQYETSKEYQRSYYEDFKSNYNNYSFGSYSDNKQSNYTDTEKKYLKRIYRAAAAKLHPDIVKDDGEGMKFLNELKEKWGI